MNPMMGKMGGTAPSMGVAPMSQAPTPQMGSGGAPSTGNVMQITSTLRGMSDQQLQQYAAMHKSDPFVFPLAFQESQTRQQMRAGSLAQRAGQKPPPVVDQDLQQMTPTPITGGAGQAITGGHGQAINALPEEQGIGAIPAQNLQGMADGGIAGYAGDDESLVHLSPFAMKQLIGDMAMSGAGVNANADFGEAGRLSGGVNLNRMDKNGDSRQTQALMANYMNDIGDVGINANVSRPLERGLPSDFYQTNLMGSVPVGEGRLTIGKHGTHAGGEHHTNAHSIGYNTPFEGGRLNANINKPVEGRPSFGVQYSRAFADGGIAGYADGGQQPGMFNYAQMAPAVDLHPDIGVTSRNMANGGLAFKGGGYKATTDEEINAITGSYAPSSAEELATQRSAIMNPMNAEMEEAYKPYTEKMAQREADLAGRKEGNIQNALLAAGLGMMAGTSPHAFANIGKGGLEGLQTYTAAQKADQAAQEALDRSNMLLMQAQRAERSGNSRDATMLLDASQKAKETHIAHGLTGLQLKNTSQYNVGQLANTELQRDIEAGKAAEQIRHDKQLEDLYYGPMGAAAGAKKANALTQEELLKNKVDAIINGMPTVKNLAARLKDSMIEVGSPEYIAAQKELYKITAGKYKQAGLPEPSYDDFVSQEAAPKPKKPGFMERMFGPSNPPPVTPGVKFLGFE